MYEIGISHLGLKILYTIINNLPEAMADRAYTPWLDLGEMIRNYDLENHSSENTTLKKIPSLESIEAKIPLTRFDCLGFTLATELTYTNILYTLDLAKIPLRNQNRTNQHPIIIAGGINAINPHPLSLFIDAFFIGEAEEGVLLINEIFMKTKDRKERLLMLSELSFMYVPDYNKSAKCIKYKNFTNSKKTHYPQLVPLLEGTHNRHTAEIMRGCSRGCRFCQAGYFYRPIREKNPEIIIEQLLDDVNKSGWNSCGLMSLSSSDYSQIKPLILKILDSLEGSGTSLSMPSMRLDSIDANLTEMLNQLKKSGITIAPEAGTQRLRDIINKNITEEEIVNASKIALQSGAKLIKLYFMIGLPFETEDDIEGIIELVEKIITATNRKIRLNISISPFVPKPKTPFQWMNISSEDEILGKALKIKHALIKYKFIKISYHTVELSYLETVLSRGDAETAKLIEQAYLDGAKFDSWRESFSYDIWKNAAEKIGYNWNKPLQNMPMNDSLPWDNIDIGISKDFLVSEYLKSEKQSTTKDCRHLSNNNCSRCGVCNSDLHNVIADNYEFEVDKTLHMEPTLVGNPTELFKATMESIVSVQQNTYRVYFSKVNELKYLSHLDFLRLIHRILMNSGLPILFSHGFNPHPKTSFCPPLSSGIEGLNEFFDITMIDSVTTEEIIKSLSKTKIKDLNFNKAELMTKKQPKICKFVNESLVVYFDDNVEKYSIMLENFLNKNDTVIIKVKNDVRKEIDLKLIILDIHFEKNKLYLNKIIQGASVFDILKKIFHIDRTDVNLRICRESIYEDSSKSVR